MKIHPNFIQMGQDRQCNRDVTDAACVCFKFYKLLHSVWTSDELLNKFICNSNMGLSMNLMTETDIMN